MKHICLCFILIINTAVEDNRTPHLIPTTCSIIFRLIVKFVLGNILKFLKMQQMLTNSLAGRYSVNIH